MFGGLFQSLTSLDDLSDRPLYKIAQEAISGKHFRSEKLDFAIERNHANQDIFSPLLVSHLTGCAPRGSAEKRFLTHGMRINMSLASELSTFIKKLSTCNSPICPPCPFRHCHQLHRLTWQTDVAGWTALPGTQRFRAESLAQSYTRWQFLDVTLDIILHVILSIRRRWALPRSRQPTTRARRSRPSPGGSRPLPDPAATRASLDRLCAGGVPPGERQGWRAPTVVLLALKIFDASYL